MSKEIKPMQCVECEWFRSRERGFCVHHIKLVDGVAPACPDIRPRPSFMKLDYNKD